MRSLRSNAGGMVWLALFALACQLMLSFGHVHLGKSNAGTAWAAPAAADNTPVKTPVKNAPGPPGTADEFCAICANLSLASVVFVPVVLALLAPVLLNAELPWPPADIAPASISHLLFDARGPPAAL
jgi:hypothetical protein